MRRRQLDLKPLSLLFVALIGAMALVGSARRAAAQNACDAVFEGVPSAQASGGTVTCTDCNAACDQDVSTTATANQSCTFHFSITTVGDCKFKYKKKKNVSSVSGAFTATVKLKAKGKKKGTTAVKVIATPNTKPKKKVTKTLVLECDPLPTGSSCGTTTSTSTSTTSTTSTSVPCASCCGSASRLTFITGAPQLGATGSCDTSDGAVTGTMVDDTGANICNLRAGGLYFGGAGVGVPLPSAVPDMSTSITKIQSCDAGTGAFTIANTTETDTGSNRTCSSANVNNPEYPGKPGCLFGPPLPVPNGNSAATSTCVINRVSTNASGSGNCSGVTSIDIPLLSDLYLTGPTDGLIPCPVCKATPGPATTCQAGPNSGQPCTPGSGALGNAYPTSHDCPPATSAFIGSLPIPFALSTGTETKSSADLSAQQFVFCGFCGQQFTPSFQNPPHPCTADSQCTTTPNTRCRQRTSGAFAQGFPRTITETGTQPACLTDGLRHAGTLVSVFCIPPSYNTTVDAAADLPGPGAVALPGQAQALP